MELLISFIIGATLIEAYAWLPNVCHWLLERAVSQVPVDEQERCRDEWRATLEALPNSAVRLLHALSLVFLGAPRITSDYREQMIEALEETILEIADFDRHLEHIAGPLVARVEAFSSQTEYLERKLYLSTGGLLETLAKFDDAVASKRLPANAQELSHAVSHCRDVAEIQNERLLQALSGKKKWFLEEAMRIVGATRAMADVLDKYVPTLVALRASELPLREWQAALEKACDDFQADINACNRSYEAERACARKSPGNNVSDCDWAEFNVAFAALKAINANIVTSIRAQETSKSKASGDNRPHETLK